MTHSLLGSFAVQSDLGDYDFDEHGQGIDYIRNIRFAPSQTDELLDKIAELHRTHRSVADRVAHKNSGHSESKRCRVFLVHSQVTIIFVVSVCLSVCLFVCAEFFSAVFDPISIKLGHTLYVWV